MDAETARELGKKLFPDTLFSPAKIVFIGYVVLSIYGPLKSQPWWIFPPVAVLFLLVEILHNDWWRIRLNHCAENDRHGLKVADETGVTGSYDIKIEFAPDIRREVPPSVPSSPPCAKLSASR